VRWFLNPTSPQTLTLTHFFADSLTHKHLSHPLLDRAEVLPCLLLLLLLLLLLFPFLFLEKLHYVATRTRSSTKYQSAIIPMRSNKSHTTPKKPSAQEFYLIADRAEVLSPPSPPPLIIPRKLQGIPQ
jgi:hypothetical protein